MAQWSVLILVYLIALASLSTESCVPRQKILDNETQLFCTLSSLTELSSFIPNPSQVKSLKISLSSGVELVPEGSFVNFTNLVNLSLSNNNIRVIKEDAFASLNHLQHLDLSANQLNNWEGNFMNCADLTYLMYIDISNNPAFELPMALLKLHRLKEIRGLSLNKACSVCTLVRNYTWQKEEESLNSERFNITISDLRKNKSFKGKKENCQINEIEVSKEVVEYTKRGFFPTCLETKKECYRNVIRVIPIHRCWDNSNKYLTAVFLISPLALILNLTVVLVTLTTRVLRRNVTMFLTCNMAFSDLILSLYAIILISSRQKTYIDFLMLQHDMCSVIGFMWLTCQIVSIKTSLILTVERFLAVVYCLEPAVRLTRKLAVAFTVLIWILGLAVAILPLMKISVYYRNTYCLPIRPTRDIPHSYQLSIGLSLWGMIVYFITIPFYVKIFFSVKKTRRRAGVRRDGTLAKRICILVLSNMFFFFFPIVIAFLWLTTNIKETMSPTKREILTGVLPTLLFSVSSFINPLLYAFRSEKFQKAIKLKIYTICLRKPRSPSWSMSVSHIATFKTTRKNRRSALPSPADVKTYPYVINQESPTTPKHDGLNGNATTRI